MLVLKNSTCLLCYLLYLHIFLTLRSRLLCSLLFYPVNIHLYLLTFLPFIYSSIFIFLSWIIFFLSNKFFSINMLTTDFLFLISRNILIFERYFTGLQILSCQFFAISILKILWLSSGFQSDFLYRSIEGNIPPPPNFSWLLLSKAFFIVKVSNNYKIL